jgi:hypothetical protein
VPLPNGDPPFEVEPLRGVRRAPLINRQPSQQVRMHRRVAQLAEADEVGALVHAAGGAGQGMVHLGAISREVGAALPAAVVVAARHLGAGCLPALARPGRGCAGGRVA